MINEDCVEESSKVEQLTTTEIKLILGKPYSCRTNDEFRFDWTLETSSGKTSKLTGHGRTVEEALESLNRNFHRRIADVKEHITLKLIRGELEIPANLEETMNSIPSLSFLQVIELLEPPKQKKTYKGIELSLTLNEADGELITLTERGQYYEEALVKLFKHLQNDPLLWIEHLSFQALFSLLEIPEPEAEEKEDKPNGKHRRMRTGSFWKSKNRWFMQSTVAGQRITGSGITRQEARARHYKNLREWYENNNQPLPEHFYKFLIEPNPDDDEPLSTKEIPASEEVIVEVEDRYRRRGTGTLFFNKGKWNYQTIENLDGLKNRITGTGATKELALYRHARNICKRFEKVGQKPPDHYRRIVEEGFKK